MIIVLTPVKNEEWILERFLQISSKFADHIIIADQNSSDNSVKIAEKFEKVILIKNDMVDYDEAQRQNLLISKARELFGIGNLLVALDADEIMSADSLFSDSWEKMKNGENGTVYCFEKPTIFFNTNQTLRYDAPGWPLAYKDDGAPHLASNIHSTRIPTPDYAKQIFIDDVKFLHLCFVRENIQFSKNRYYCVIENINKVRDLRKRRILYRAVRHEDYIDEGKLMVTEPYWYTKWDESGINIRDFEQQQYYWMDFEVLRIFDRYGTTRFFNDNVWDFNWEACRKKAIEKGEQGIPLSPLEYPSKFRRVFLRKVFNLVYFFTKVKRKISNVR